MKTNVWAAPVLAAALMAGSAAIAQQPFNTPYGTPISLEKAQAAVGAAVAEANKRGWQLNVAVVDSGGNLVTFARMDGAQLASIAISEHKARAAAKYRRQPRLSKRACRKAPNIS
jgi:uncharacterized protein GlcG (DUF336 family)